MSSEAERDDRVFRALADRRRREILDLLRRRSRTTGELCDHFARRLDRCTVMQHLGVMEQAGLLIVRREGRVRWNHLDVAPLARLHQRWISPYASAAVGLLSRLKRELEKEPPIAGDEPLAKAPARPMRASARRPGRQPAGRRRGR